MAHNYAYTLLKVAIVCIKSSHHALAFTYFTYCRNLKYILPFQIFNMYTWRFTKQPQARLDTNKFL